MGCSSCWGTLADSLIRYALLCGCYAELHLAARRVEESHIARLSAEEEVRRQSAALAEAWVAIEAGQQRTAEVEAAAEASRRQSAQLAAEVDAARAAAEQEASVARAALEASRRQATQAAEQARAALEAAQQRASELAARVAAEEAARREVEGDLSRAHAATEAADQRARDAVAELEASRAEVQRLRAATVAAPPGPATTAQASGIGMISHWPLCNVGQPLNTVC